MATVRYHKRRLQRPWLSNSNGAVSRSHQGLLGNHREESNYALDESEEDEVLMDHNVLNPRDIRRKQQANADAYIQMLHSPTGQRSAPTLPRV